MIALPHPHVRVVGLPELNLFNDRELVLNWIGQARRHPKDPFRLQVFARFLDVKNGSRHDVWVSLERICLLILESHWRGGIMVGKPLGVRQFSLKGDVPQHWITPTVLLLMAE